MAPEVGLEPTTRRLTAGCSTIELLWNSRGRNVQAAFHSVKTRTRNQNDESMPTERVRARLLKSSRKLHRVFSTSLRKISAPIRPRIIRAVVQRRILNSFCTNTDGTPT